MRSTRILFAAVLALTAASTASPPAGAASAPRAVRPTANVTLTAQDNTRSVTVTRGATVTVRLAGTHNDTGNWSWTVPVAGSGRVLKRVRTGTTRAGAAVAVFRARNSGRTDIQAEQRCSPVTGHVCPGAVIAWRATVAVR